jgi:hypothetical protein
MREDVIYGVLDMYGYKDRSSKDKETLERNNTKKARYLVMKSLRNKKVSPWNEAETVMLQRVVKTLEGENHTKDEVLDIAITCVYDAHVLEWLVNRR